MVKNTFRTQSVKYNSRKRSHGKQIRDETTSQTQDQNRIKILFSFLHMTDLMFLWRQGQRIKHRAEKGQKHQVCHMEKRKENFNAILILGLTCRLVSYLFSMWSFSWIIFHTLWSKRIFHHFKIIWPFFIFFTCSRHYKSGIEEWI